MFITILTPYFNAETNCVPNATTDATTPKTHDERLQAFLVEKDAQLHCCKVARYHQVPSPEIVHGHCDKHPARLILD
ncbi:hypothetical protein LC653_22830 [Nostoc sp. CHAB 5784]|uniref:hypothetical protein n=1 Tax=Nostoc mirabile TaxID=2907820 RepID=UPI001E30D1D2|nr:hypothetical protein [Nostoc mirabile]MCC5666642.1 hypothetical protein [Nostoc mirabile CHAB5784]